MGHRHAAMMAVFLAASPASAALSAERPQVGEMVVHATIPRAGFPLGFGFDAVWMMSEGRLVKVDPLDNSFLDIEIPTGADSASLADIDRYRGIAVGEGAVWVPDMASSAIYKVDPRSNDVVLKIPTDIFGGAGNIGVGEGSVWAITFDNHNKTLTRYNATSAAVEAQIKLPRPGLGVLVEYGSVWVSAANDAELYRIDPKTNQIAATIAIHAASHILAAAEHSIWVAFDTEGIVQRIDAATGDVIATIETGAHDMESDGDIATGGGFIWTINRGSLVSKIDPITNLTKGTFGPPAGTTMGRRVRYGAGSLWISGSSIFRVSPPP